MCMTNLVRKSLLTSYASGEKHFIKDRRGQPVVSVGYKFEASLGINVVRMGAQNTINTNY